MLAVERRNEIERLVNKNKRVLVTELAGMFDVTPETIRGDLLKLESGSARKDIRRRNAFR